MNLGQAVAVCLYELARDSASAQDRENREPEKKSPAKVGELEQITTGLYEALKVSGYVKPGNDLVSEKKVRRLMLRLGFRKWTPRYSSGWCGKSFGSCANSARASALPAGPTPVWNLA